ncbi:MAG: hypothetical protein K6G65_00395 [Lachnospiraceae bacterium]|nr:hypothetical protein [Lachnospiraceae bacterium]
MDKEELKTTEDTQEEMMEDSVEEEGVVRRNPIFYLAVGLFMLYEVYMSAKAMRTAPFEVPKSVILVFLNVVIFVFGAACFGYGVYRMMAKGRAEVKHQEEQIKKEEMEAAQKETTDFGEEDDDN